MVSSRDFEIVGHVLPVVLNLPSSCHVAVRHTNIKVVGELAEWIEKHLDYLGTCALFMVWFICFWCLIRSHNCLIFVPLYCSFRELVEKLFWCLSLLI